jgi:hypothetical protein
VPLVNVLHISSRNETYNLGYRPHYRYRAQYSYLESFGTECRTKSMFPYGNNGAIWVKFKDIR